MIMLTRVEIQYTVNTHFIKHRSNHLQFYSAFLDPVSHSQQKLVSDHVLINPHQPHICVHVDLKQIHLLISATIKKGIRVCFYKKERVMWSEVICHVSPPLCCCSERWSWWQRWGSRTPDWHTDRAPRTLLCCHRGTCEWSSTQRTTAPYTRPATETQHAVFPCSHLILQIPACLFLL